MIAVDDAHWIDPPSAGALLFALRRLHGDRALVLIASRPEGLSHLGPSWSRLLDDPDRVRRITLTGLDASQVGELAESLGAGQLSAAAGERLAEHTSGHPLYVKALLSELSSERLNRPDRELPAPHSFSATVMARLTKLPVDAQDLVAAAAVAGQRCELAFAAAVAGIGDPLPAVEEALGADLLSLVPVRLPQEVEFAHPLMRAAVYDDLSVTRRRALHLACAELSAEPASLAHRVAASDGADDELAAELRTTAEAEIAAFRLTAGIQRLMWVVAARRRRSGARARAAAGGRVSGAGGRHPRREQSPRRGPGLQRQPAPDVHDWRPDRGRRARIGCRGFVSGGDRPPGLRQRPRAGWSGDLDAGAGVRAAGARPGRDRLVPTGPRRPRSAPDRADDGP